MAAPRSQYRLRPSTRETEEPSYKRINSPKPKPKATPKAKPQAQPQPKADAKPPTKRGRKANSAMSRQASLNSLPVILTKHASIFCFVTVSMRELGLGPKLNARTLKRPRLNQFLLPEHTKIVDVSVGRMHVAVLDEQGYP
jgi:alpha-tubulin suppressor-like RCC1 family protein